jgi:hypothetical protein
MPNCKDVSRQIAGGELEGTGLGRRLSVLFHLLMCKYCRRYARQIRSIGEMTRARHADRPTPDEAAKLERVKETLLNEGPPPPTA